MINKKDFKRIAVIILTVWVFGAIGDTLSKTNQNISYPANTYSSDCNSWILAYGPHLKAASRFFGK